VTGEHESTKCVRGVDCENSVVRLWPNGGTAVTITKFVADTGKRVDDCCEPSYELRDVITFLEVIRVHVEKLAHPLEELADVPVVSAGGLIHLSLDVEKDFFAQRSSISDGAGEIASFEFFLALGDMLGNEL
jgi:hypothetical protein